VASAKLLLEAREEVVEAFEWYLERSQAAAESFLSEVDHSLALIAETPEVWPEFESGTRRYLLRRYPFALIYRSRGGLIEIVAFAHQRRKPGYWSNR
jgi:plasmid stabilization system protein ParE